ncbi:MAG TPA: NfeD family protein [Thermotogota bacterium]|nr:NfeD family protein [Thermotogaceae bacterium]HNR64621.1 NfeD family protein [Thermotogota bacterium]HOZ13087.1 NfeD family protein [Thermotogota bacterium]HPB88236.1 NfeD family protein [Thermotogota bacterium]HPE42083.1 NfeD family protein [Thermotogota bacterium]
MNPTIFWLILGVLFLIAEIFTPSFFIMWFGIGSFAAMLVAFLFENSVLYQAIVFIVVSLIFVLFTRKMAQKMSGKPSRLISQDEMIGKEGVVSETITADGGKGLVRINKDIWRARSLKDQEILAGAKIKVIELKGVTITVDTVETK